MKKPVQRHSPAGKRRYRRGRRHPHRANRFFYNYKDGQPQWLTARGLASHRARAKRYRRNHTRGGYAKTLEGRARKLWGLAQRRAQAKHQGFPLKVDDVRRLLVKAGGRCPVSGVKFGDSPFAYWGTNPTLDKKIPRLLYTCANTALVSMKVNNMKRSYTNGSFLRAVADYIDWCAAEHRHPLGKAKGLGPRARVKDRAQVTFYQANHPWDQEVDPRLKLARQLWCKARHRARASRGKLPFTISVADVYLLVCQARNRCPVTGVKFGSGRHGAKATNDQKKPGVGYTPANLAVISWRVNIVKSRYQNGKFLRAVANYIDRCAAEERRRAR